MARFETDNINLAAFLVTAGYPTNTLYSPTAGKALFDFADTLQLRNAIIAYESGSAALPAKALLLTRTRLYHEASRVSGRGRL